MVEETITQVEARIKKAKSLNDERKKELLDLLSTLKAEVSQLAKTDSEDAKSITGFTEVSIHEAIREGKNPQLLKLSLKGLSTSVEGFESSHPKLVGIVNWICNPLSNIGIWKKRQGLPELRIMNHFTEMILKPLGFWDMKARPHPEAIASNTWDLLHLQRIGLEILEKGLEEINRTQYRGRRKGSVRNGSAFLVAKIQSNL